jgi:SAM-dependent methyltransferase
MVNGVARLWREQALPRLTDASLRGHDVGRLRDQTCVGMHGRVLEIGFGSGLNVRFYPAEVTAVDAVEPADVAWALSERRRARSSVPVSRTGLDGQRLEADDASYDAVLTTFTLCTIPDVDTALAEVRRVLRPGGRVHFLEHGLAPQAGVARWQRRLEPVHRRIAGGCHLTRAVPGLLESAGFTVESLREQPLPGPAVNRPWSWLFLGRAVRCG